MAFTESFLENQRWYQFSFYETGHTADGMDESIAFATREWKLAEIRMHFSIAMISIFDLVIYLSSARGSAYNTKLLSQALLTVQDLWVHYSDALLFQSGDQLVFAHGSTVTVNHRGTEVIGWAVIN